MFYALGKIKKKDLRDGGRGGGGGEGGGGGGGGPPPPPPPTPQEKYCLLNNKIYTITKYCYSEFCRK